MPPPYKSIYDDPTDNPYYTPYYKRYSKPPKYFSKLNNYQQLKNQYNKINFKENAQFNPYNWGYDHPEYKYFQKYWDTFSKKQPPGYVHADKWFESKPSYKRSGRKILVPKYRPQEFPPYEYEKHRAQLDNPYTKDALGTRKNYSNRGDYFKQFNYPNHKNMWLAKRQGTFPMSNHNTYNPDQPIFKDKPSAGYPNDPQLHKNKRMYQHYLNTIYPYQDWAYNYDTNKKEDFDDTVDIMHKNKKLGNVGQVGPIGAYYPKKQDKMKKMAEKYERKMNNMQPITGFGTSNVSRVPNDDDFTEDDINELGSPIETPQIQQNDISDEVLDEIADL